MTERQVMKVLVPVFTVPVAILFGLSFTQPARTSLGVQGPVLTQAIEVASASRSPQSLSSQIISAVQEGPNFSARITNHATLVANSLSAVRAQSEMALEALSPLVGQLSSSKALPKAFVSYFFYRSANPDQPANPYLYFVDYGLPGKVARGYVFEMSTFKIVEGPFMVAHGRGSAPAGETVPTRFSNNFGAATTSLGLYLAQELYPFRGHAGGRLYKSIGLRLQGLSDSYNNNARARGVVAHGAPYVTANRAGRSEGCPAMEPDRAERILPKLANGGLVFLFAPDANWLSQDPWASQLAD